MSFYTKRNQHMSTSLGDRGRVPTRVSIPEPNLNEEGVYVEVQVHISWAGGVGWMGWKVRGLVVRSIVPIIIGRPSLSRATAIGSSREQNNQYNGKNKWNRNYGYAVFF